MFIFAEERRPKLKHERADLSESELTRQLARMWNELPEKKKVNEDTEIIQMTEYSVSQLSQEMSGNSRILNTRINSTT